ncbi:hypothetical protein ASPWEDRAFT_41093 [Aspergillus wentii DTO 134E9]|uniref:Uncharacterized protein n=1 Tax=Aspergillus wentii DTO 134E9 TaxID=1073089 RepID=A0A1L9RLZ6_ASPWE|nr:uncharacterized protein ASPWEDRAFT_41093 [Aspergillus wentii DTO 134E9]OJJ35857.1 hypothetical protein ASPWEDRAFT_41093 [Aspergillus wentii DTO 134E9]
MSDLPLKPPRKVIKVPANIYYRRPFSPLYFILFTFFGSFGCSWYSDYLDWPSTILIWAIYVSILLVFIAIEPTCTLELDRVDDLGNKFIVRRPLVGFRSCEQAVPLAAIEEGLVWTEYGEPDSRLTDGYRYGPAFWRI